MEKTNINDEFEKLFQMIYDKIKIDSEMTNEIFDERKAFELNHITNAIYLMCSIQLSSANLICDKLDEIKELLTNESNK